MSLNHALRECFDRQSVKDVSPLHDVIDDILNDPPVDIIFTSSFFHVFISFVFSSFHRK